MSDEKIIDLFFARDEQAIRACIDTYETYCRTVASGILSDPADVEEAVADTWLAAWDAIPPQRPDHLRLFLGRITRNRAVDIFRKNSARRRGRDQVEIALEELSQCASPAGSPEQAVDAKQLAAAINCFLENESLSRRQVFLRRYFYLEDIPTIAHRYGLREVNVRMMLSRTRQKLRQFLIQGGYL